MKEAGSLLEAAMEERSMVLKSDPLLKSRDEPDV